MKISFCIDKTYLYILSRQYDDYCMCRSIMSIWYSHCHNNEILLNVFMIARWAKTNIYLSWNVMCNNSTKHNSYYNLFVTKQVIYHWLVRLVIKPNYCMQSMVLIFGKHALYSWNKPDIFNFVIISWTKCIQYIYVLLHGNIFVIVLIVYICREVLVHITFSPLERHAPGVHAKILHSIHFNRANSLP